MTEQLEQTIHRLAHLTHSTVVVTAAPWPGELLTQYRVVATVGTRAVCGSDSSLEKALAACEAEAERELAG